MEDQRRLDGKLGHNGENMKNGFNNDDEQCSDDVAFLETIIKCQSSRIDDQRSALPGKNNDDDEGGSQNEGSDDEDFFELLTKIQSDRFDEQRASLISANGNLNCATEEKPKSPSQKIEENLKSK